MSNFTDAMITAAGAPVAETYGHDPDTERTARAAVAAVLLELAAWGDSYNPELRLHAHQRRALKSLAEGLAADQPATNQQGER